MNMNYAGGTATNVPFDLISSDRVEGTSVFRSDGDKVGRIERLMIEKRSGKTLYAIMNFGGFLGIGEDSYPLPWSLLTYTPELGGYEVNISDAQLKGAFGPSFTPLDRSGDVFSWDPI